MNVLLRFLRREWLQLLLLLVPLVAVWIALPQVSDRVPMQWDFQGHVNWYAPKTWGLLVLPGMMVLVILMVMMFEHFDPNRLDPATGEVTEHGLAVRHLRHGISVLMTGVSFIQIAAALGKHPDVSRLVPVGVALLFAYMGLLFGKLKRNRYAGFRVPWTMNSDFVWERTHRVAGKMWLVSSLIVAAVSWFLPLALMNGVFLGWIVVLVLAPLFVAWRAASAEKNGAA